MRSYHFLISAFCLLFLISEVHAQVNSVTISGLIRSKTSKSTIPYINVQLKTPKDGTFVAGTISQEDGRFSLVKIKPGSYLLEISGLSFKPITRDLFVGTASEYLEIPGIELEDDATQIEAVSVKGHTDGLSSGLDKKTYDISNNLSQLGGSVLQGIQNLPGITVQDSKILLRGSDKVIILIDGKQTALTGFNGQTGLDNLPASGIDKIEIINNPSAKYDANGNAGIINIIMKKEQKQGFNGKVGLSAGLGALWIRKDNLPTIRPQYHITPKINPSIALNYRKNKVNFFLQADNLYTQTLNKNEFVSRYYDDGTEINSQLKRNRNTNFLNTKAGLDWFINDKNTLTISGLFGSEKIMDRGDQPFFNGDLSDRLRLWQFLEDELKTTATGNMTYQHKFNEEGHFLNLGMNYTFHREDEKYFYDNILANSASKDAFKLISDEQVFDVSLDYSKPLRFGKLETGIKLRKRYIPTNMQFIPGEHSVLDLDADGWANYHELIPAVYGNYLLDSKNWEAELGLRLEYVKINYEVNPDHKTYKTDGYNYFQPFPNFRLSYKLNAQNKLSINYNRRVDRPNEVDIRIFPKYDDAEIIKVGNPGLRPQFTNSFEIGYKNTWDAGYLYAAAYHRFSDGTISRIASTVPGSTLIYAVFQNAGRSYNSGIETILAHKFSSVYQMNLTANIYRNQINAFTVENKYPVPSIYSSEKQSAFSGNIKWINNLKMLRGWDTQFSLTYLAPDIIPQGKIKSRFSVDLGTKKAIQKSKGEIFLNATDLFNTLKPNKTVNGNGFYYTSTDYYETQVIRLGYIYKF